MRSRSISKRKSPRRKSISPPPTKTLLAKEKAAKKDAKAIDAAKKKTAAAKTALDTAREAVAKPPADYPPLAPSYPEQSTGRRLALAKWITAKENPLTARVFVNHVWLRHFGQPLVPTVFDFGKNGRPPTHPRCSIGSPPTSWNRVGT